jgi:hypothetical protein
MHPEFGLLCPTPRLRRRVRIAVACAVLAFITVAVLTANNSPLSEMTRAVGGDGVSAARDADRAVTLAAPSRTEAAQSERGKTDCEQNNSVHHNFVQRAWAYLDSRCVAGKARKRRIFRLPANRPDLAAIALGHMSALSERDAPDAASKPVERQAEPSTSSATTSVPAVAAVESSQQPVATSKRKPQKTARRENRRRDPDRRDAPWWREVRAEEWDAHGYGGRERDFGRDRYGREGFYGYMR